MTSTAYPPAACASKAVTGTVSAWAALPVVIVTVTGAEFSRPAALGWMSEASTVIVAADDPDPLPSRRRSRWPTQRLQCRPPPAPWQRG